MHRSHFPFLPIILSLLFFACEPTTQQQENPPQTDSTDLPLDTVAADPSLSDEATAAQEAIVARLRQYYDDLENKQLDESQYFAPVVEVFYSQKNQSREKIGQIIRSGFENIIERKITMDERSYRFSQSGDQYVLEFEGFTRIRRKGENGEKTESFNNRFVFNSDYQIIEYGPALQAKNMERMAAPQEAAVADISRFLQALSELDFEQADSYIHPELKLRFITRPGAYDVIYELTSLKEVIEFSTWMKDAFQAMDCEIALEAMPQYDCEDFSKEGCFLDEVKEFDRLVSNMQALSEAELNSFTQGQMNDAVEVQQAVQLQFANTSQTTAMFFGNIDGKWYLLIIDKALYDCSA